MVTADMPISDTHFGDGVAKTVYFNNADSAGVVTAAFVVSGTPQLTLLADDAFGEPMLRVYTSSMTSAAFVVTYTVDTLHGTQSDVEYAALNGSSNLASIEIDYVRDVVAPSVTVTAPPETAGTSFAVSWAAVDPMPGAGVEGLYTVVYRELDGAWEPWLSSTVLTGATFFSATVEHTYTFSVTVKDRVDNHGEGVAVTHVGQFRTYLPVALRGWVWWYGVDVYEPNNKIAQAYGPLTSDQVYEAYIWDATDTDDYYYFESTVQGTVQITLTDIPTGSDYDMYVYYHDGNQYVEQDRSNNTGTQDELVSFVSVAGRVYYIRIYPFSGDSHQPYHLCTYQ